MYRTVQLKCMSCGEYIMTSINSRTGELDQPIEDYYVCECDNENLKVIEMENVQDPGAFLSWADDELESANYHSQCGLPWSIYENMIYYIAIEDRPLVAKAIAKVFVDNI